MASDTGDSRRKHRRTSDDDDEDKSSKRHKHRHHHRHHRSRHSKKRDEESKIDGEEAAPPAIHQPPAAPNGSLPDDDVEEGEILDEDEGIGGCDVEFDRSSKQNLAAPDDGHLTGGDVDHDSSPRAEERAKKKHSNLKTVKEDWNENDSMDNLTLEKEDKTSSRRNFANKMNGEVALRRHPSTEPKGEVVSGGSPHDHNVDNRKRRESDISLRGSGREKRYDYADHGEADENRLPSKRNSLSPTRLGDKHKPSLSCDRYEDEVHPTTRPRSLERAQERSHSHNVGEEDVHSKRRYHSSYHAPKDKNEYDSDEGRMSRRSKDRLPDSGDLVGDDDRERNRSLDRGEKGRSRENESDKDYKGDDRRREKERERSKDRDHGRERDRARSRDIEQGRERERERRDYIDHGRDRERERGRDSRDHIRDRERGRSRDSRDHVRDRERGRSRDSRDHVRDRERGRSRDSRDHVRDRELGRSRDMDHRRDREQERSRDRDYRSKDRDGDRDRRQGDWKDKDRERENNRDGNRVKDRKWESERDRRTERIQDVEIDKEKYKNREDDYVDRDRHRHSRLSRHDESEYQDRSSKNNSAVVQSSKSDSLEEGEAKQTRDEDEQEDYEETVPLHLAEQEEEDLNRIKEESRRRRQAILEKYKSQQSQQKTEPQSGAAEKEKVSTEHSSKLVNTGNGVPEIRDDCGNGVDTSGADPAFSVGKSPSQNGISTSERNTSAGGLGEGTPKSEISTDMFCDDIFGDSPAGVRKSGKGDSLLIERSGFHDNWDDADGYYSYRFGEILDGRYEVTAAHGKGVFSTVVRARDLKASNGEPEEVAIKIIRNNDTMYKAGIEELGILNKLVGADPDDRRHCVRFLSSFKYRNHLCLVFESLHMNLREVLKKFGRNIGLKLTAVRVYSKQLFIALKHLKNCGVLHCDIKPDNMLVNEAKNVLKLCDFGNAMYAGKNEITPYLVSRFYRAPEIILGLPYDHPLDIWSVGCCLFELYTGKVLFPGHTNNDMLRLHMELKGPFPKKMLRKGGFIEQHFDQDLNFLATEDDPVTKKIIRRTLFNIKPKDIGSIISGSSGEDPKMLANFKDLLEKIFMLDPEKRMTVSQALNHPFITGK